MSLDEVLKNLNRSIKRAKSQPFGASRNQNYVDSHISLFMRQFLPEINVEIFLTYLKQVGDQNICDSLVKQFVQEHTFKIDVDNIIHFLDDYVNNSQIKESIIEIYVNEIVEPIILNKNFEKYKFFKIRNLIETVKDIKLKQNLLNNFSGDKRYKVLENYVKTNVSNLRFDEVTSLIKKIKKIDIRDSLMKFYFNENFEKAVINHYFNEKGIYLRDLATLPRLIVNPKFSKKLSDKLYNKPYIYGILRKYFNENISQFNNQNVKRLLDKIDDDSVKNEFLKKYDSLILEKRQNI